MKKLDIKPNEIKPEAKVSLKKRIITGLIMSAVCFPCVILGNWVFFVLMLVITVMAGYELVHITQLQGKIRVVVYVLTITLLILLVNYIFLKNNWELIKAGKSVTAWEFVNNNFMNVELSSMSIIVVAITFFFISFLNEKMTMFYVFYFITMIIVVSIGLQSFLYLRFSPYQAWSEANPDYLNNASFNYFESLLLILFIAIGTMMNDIGAYFVGMLFGKHKMNPRISPKKTWEGFAGGIIISALFSIAFALILAAVGKPILPRFTLDKWYWIILVALVMPIVGDIGDFVFSAIKRNAGIKDFSNLLPGHGGLLDRFDSLLFAGGSVAGMIAFMDFVSPIIQNISEISK